MIAMHKAKGPKHGVESNGMRVLYVIPGNSQGASMIFVRRQLSALEKIGVTVHPFYLASRTSPRKLMQEIKRLRHEIKTIEPHIVHAQYGTMTAFLTALSLTGKFRKPLVITFRGSDLNPSSMDKAMRFQAMRSWSGRIMSQLAARRAAGIICVSQQLKSRLWWCQEKVSIIPSGVDTSLFFPQDQQAARLALDWPLGEKIVLFNAGLKAQIANKRLDLAEAAVKFAGGSIKHLKFIVMNGEIGPEKVPLMMNAADCLLMTSDCEGSPNVVKEALACNLPIVSVNVGDVPERLADVSPSRLVERDAEKIGAAIIEVINENRRSNGFVAIQPISIDNLALQIKCIYERLLVSNSN